MPQEQGARTPIPVKQRYGLNRIALAAIALLVAFLAGFLPPYMKGTRLENELRDARQENSMARLRDLASLAYLQANQKNYGMAADTATRFFNETRETTNRMPDSAGRKSLESLLTLRDPITAKLATADSEVVGDLQALLIRTREATFASSDAP